MNICLVSPIPPPAGGIASWTIRYMESTKAKEHDIHLVNTAVTGNRIYNIKKRNLLSEISRTVKILNNVKNECKSGDRDVIHINCPCGALGLIRDYYIAKISKTKNVKVITHFRCDVSYQIKNSISKYYLKKLVNKSDKIITLNENSDIYIRRECDKESIIIPNFISDSLVKRAFTTKSIGEDITKVLYVGHVVASKGCKTILEVAKKNPQISFTLAGYISPEITKMNYSDNVIFTGELKSSEVERYINEADVFLFPSHTEGFSNALAEAMAYGLPIITTDVGANKDMIEDKGGIIVGIDDVEGICKAIKILHDGDIRKKMSAWNKVKVIKNYSINTIMGELFKIYEG